MKQPQTLLIARIKAGWTQKMLAQVCDVTQTTISHLETGKTYPQEITKKRIEIALGSPIDWQRTKYDAIIRSNGKQVTEEI